MKRLLLVTILGCLTAMSVDAQSTNQSQTLAPVTIAGTPPTDIPQVESVAANTMPGSEVERAEINNTRDLSTRAPNLTVFDANNDRSPKFSLRGFRENNFAAGEPVVGMYVDGVPYFDLYSRGFPLFDVYQIEFLRGSQATLYGASGIGGVINIETVQPDNNWHGHGDVSYGNYNYQDYRVGIYGPIVKDKLFLGVSGIYALRDGFVYNNVTQMHPDYRDTLAGRLSLRWTPSDPWSFTFIADAQRFNDGFVPTYVPRIDKGPFSVNRDLNGFVDTDAVNEAFKIAYTSPDFVVTSVSAHRDWRQRLLQDFDFSPAPIVNGFSNPKVEQWSEELKIHSPADAEKLQWLGGLFFLNNDQHTDSGTTGLIFTPDPTPFASRTTAHLENNTYGVFGQATYNVWCNLDLTAGLRLSYDERSMNRSKATSFGNVPLSDVSDHFSALQPKIAATWHFTPQFETYASATIGHQSGGFNPSQDDPRFQEYGSTRSWQFELGAKSSWMDNRVHADAALFYNETHGYEVFAFNPLNASESFVLNAPRASSFGAELDLSARPYDPLELNLNLGWTHASYENFIDPTTGKNLKNNRISFVPEFTANFSAKYRLPAHFYIQGEIQALGTYFLDEGDNFRQQPFALVSGQFGYDIKNIDVYVFARNIFNERYTANALDLQAGGLGVVQQPGDPLTFGFVVSAKF